MPRIIERPPDPGDPRRPLLSRLGWFAALALAGAATTAVIAYTL